MILEPNKKFQTVYDDKSGSSHEENIDYPIIIGIHFRAFDFVKTLISISGAEINNTDMKNPLELVIEQVYNKGVISSDNESEQNKNMMFYLIEHGASFQIKEENKNYIACHAILEQNTIALNSLLEDNFSINSKIAYVHDKSRNLPLVHLAAKYNKPESLSLLIEKDSSVLHQAVMGQSLDVIKLLIGIVNIINDQDNLGDTPLHLAVKNDYHEIVDLLLSNGARFDIKTNDGYTPLHFAVMYNAYESAKILIDYNSDINSKNIYEVPIIFTAMNYKYYEMTKLLIKNKAEVNYTYKENEVELNLLYLAVTKGFPIETIKFLFKEGIKGDILDYQGNNLLHLAIEYDSPIDIANFFL